MHFTHRCASKVKANNQRTDSLPRPSKPSARYATAIFLARTADALAAASFALALDSAMSVMRAKSSAAAAVFAAARVRRSSESADYRKRGTGYAYDGYDAKDVHCESSFVYWQAHESMPEADKQEFYARMAATESAWMRNELDYDCDKDDDDASESADSLPSVAEPQPQQWLFW
jgi:hypothetical protein